MTIADVEAELTALALADYPTRICPTAHCRGRKVEARFATRAEQLEMSTGRVPTVVWHCDSCRSICKEVMR